MVAENRTHDAVVGSFYFTVPIETRKEAIALVFGRSSVALPLHPCQNYAQI